MSRIKRDKPSATMPVIGQVKVGEKTEQGYPRSLDYFKASGRFENAFHKQFGKKPTELTVVFMSDEVDQVCDERYELWKGANGLGSNFHAVKAVESR